MANQRKEYNVENYIQWVSKLPLTTTGLSSFVLLLLPPKSMKSVKFSENLTL